MTAVASPSASGNLLASILSEDSFRPAEPRTIEETGLTAARVETLIVKYPSAAVPAIRRCVAAACLVAFATASATTNHAAAATFGVKPSG